MPNGYHTIHIGKLSPTQISKILNSHPVRIKGGSAHSIDVSVEQLKKFAKAHNLGKSYTISLDPFQIQNHQHLRGGKTGTDLGKILGKVAGKAAQDAGVRLTSAISGTDPSDASYDQTGSGVNRLHKGKRWLGFVQHELGAQKVQDALMNKAVSAIHGSGVNRLKKAQRWTGFVQNSLGAQKVQDAIMNKAENALTYGSGVNRLKKAQRWTGFVQNNLGLQPVQDALMNVASNGVTYGFGLKKRVVKMKKKILGRALFNA